MPKAIMGIEEVSFSTFKYVSEHFYTFKFILMNSNHYLRVLFVLESECHPISPLVSTISDEISKTSNKLEGIFLN